MPIQIQIHPIYRVYTDRQTSVFVDGTSVIDCLRKLVTQFPLLQKELFDKDGTLSQIPVIFRNNKVVKENSLNEPVSPTDIIRVDLFLSGG